MVAMLKKGDCSDMLCTTFYNTNSVEIEVFIVFEVVAIAYRRSDARASSGINK